jgi:hypothetical protein
MTSPLDRFRRAADVGRRAVDSLGMRPTTVTIRVETWSAAYGTAGATLVSASETVLSPSPKVSRAASTPSYFGGGAASNSGASLSAESYVIGPITPAFSAGGYTIAQLAPTQVDTTMRVLVKLAGGNEFDDAGENFVIAPGGVDATRPLRVMLTVQRTQQ